MMMRNGMMVSYGNLAVLRFFRLFFDLILSIWLRSKFLILTSCLHNFFRRNNTLHIRFVFRMFSSCNDIVMMMTTDMHISWSSRELLNLDNRHIYIERKRWIHSSCLGDRFLSIGEEMIFLKAVEAKIQSVNSMIESMLRVCVHLMMARLSWFIMAQMAGMLFLIVCVIFVILHCVARE